MSSERPAIGGGKVAPAPPASAGDPIVEPPAATADPPWPLGDPCCPFGGEPARAAAADPVQARRLIQNLIDNALAHASGMSQLTISTRDTPNGVELCVQDDGAGVPQAELARLFDRFYRTDKSRKAGGSGLGLSIVRQVAELHGGSATAELVSPKGLRIIVTLPGAEEVYKGKTRRVSAGFCSIFKVERATGLEPATATLARWYSTIELRARWEVSRPNALTSVKPLDKPHPDSLGSRV